MPTQEEDTRLTARDAVGFAFTAYVAVKLFQGLTSVATSAVLFNRNRKAN